MKLALVDRLRLLPAEDIDAILGSLTWREKALLRWQWREFWARPDEREPGAVLGRGQLPPPGDWTWWALIGGRGSGKTRPAAEWISERQQELGRGSIAILLGQSMALARRDMIEGPSGLATISPPWAGFDFEPSKALCTWRSGAKAYLFSADNEDATRGPNANLFWGDDLAAFGPSGLAVFQTLSNALRIDSPDGTPYQGVLSTTPLDSPVLRYVLEAREGKRRSKYVFSEAATDDNAANLSAKFLSETMAELEGTDQEEQERYGRFDLERSSRIFGTVDFAACRVAEVPDRFDLIVFWIDPARSSNLRSDDVGIIAAGIRRDLGLAYLLEDASGNFDSDTWPQRAWDMAERWMPRAGRTRWGIEDNTGGANASLIKSEERTRSAQRNPGGVATSIADVRAVTSRTVKAERARPLPAIYRAGQIKHGPGLDRVVAQLRSLTEAERQQQKLDRADAAVYALLDLFGHLDDKRPITALGSSGSSVRMFGPSAQGSIAVGPEASSGGLTMLPPGRAGVSVFGRSGSGW